MKILIGATHRIAGTSPDFQCLCGASGRTFDVGCAAVSHATAVGKCHCLGLFCELESLGSSPSPSSWLWFGPVEIRGFS